MNKIYAGLLLFLIQVHFLISKQNDTPFSMRPYLLYHQSINHPLPQSTLTFSHIQTTSNLQIPTGLPSQSIPNTRSNPTTSTSIDTISQKKLLLQKQIQELIEGGSEFFQEDISSLYPIMYQAAERNILYDPDVNNQVIHEAVRLLTSAGKTHNGILACNQTCDWFAEHDMSNASINDQIMLNYMMVRMLNCSNDTVIELAQNCLHSWSKEQKAQTQQEHDIHQQMYTTCYHALYNQAQFQNFADHVQPVQKYQLEQLVDEYNSQQIDTHHDEHYKRLELRKKCLESSLQDPKLTDHNFVLSPQVIGFMMAHDINYAAFQNKNCLMFQHCVTREAFEIVKSIVNLHEQHHNSAYQDYLVHTCNLAVCGQQLNQQSKIEQAVAVIDLSHFFENFARLLHGPGLSGAFHVGSGRALDKWIHFAHQLSQQPQQTIGKIIQSYYEIACIGCKLFESVCSVTHFIQTDEIIQDLQEQLQAMQLGGYKNPFENMQQRTEQRLHRTVHVACDGIQSIVGATQTLITSMLQKPLYENIADVGEITADTIITGKVTESLLYVAQFVANKTIHVSTTLQQLAPDNLRNNPIKFMKTDHGEIVAVASTTGENIGDMIAAAGQKLMDPIAKMTQAIAKAKIISDKIKEIIKPNNSEIAAFQKSIKPHFRMDKIVELEKLKAIKDVPQVEEFRKYTNNFTNLEKLTPEEILYLNLCNWLDPKAKAINAALKKRGGIDIIHPKTKKILAHIKEYDLFHSLLGEMSPEAVANRIKGGHLFIPELRAALLDTGEIKAIGAGFFDMDIKYAGKISSKYKRNSYFPMGTSVEEAVDMIEKAIKHSKNIKALNVKDPAWQGFIFTNKQGQDFAILTKNKTMQFYPMKPE